MSPVASDVVLIWTVAQHTYGAGFQKIKGLLTTLLLYEGASEAHQACPTLSTQPGQAELGRPRLRDDPEPLNCASRIRGDGYPRCRL
jgi:hypothetical protein